MQKKSRILIILAAIVLLAAGAVFLLTQYVFADGKLYSRSSQELDLRGTGLTAESYRSLAEKLPDCRILWDVPFQGGTLPSDTRELTVTSLTDEDVAALSHLTELATVHGEGCADYAQLARLQEEHPEAAVLYRVNISGKDRDPDTTELTLTELTAQDAANLAYLPKLGSVSVSGCTDYALLQQLQAEHPEWNLRYTVALGGEEFDADAASVQVQGATAEELSQALTGLTELQDLYILNPKADHTQLQQLRTDYPGVEIRWAVELYGQTVTEDVVELDISGAQVASCEEVEQLVACLPKLEKLIMSDCGIDSETMAQFRERQRENYKVVWTVYLSDKCKARTDDIYFMPIQQGEYYLKDEHTEELKYCEDMICIDVGHHMIHNIDFVAYMPHLKYLILAHTGVRDVSPIVNCQELVYLEVDWSEIRDYTPIKELKALEDLNLTETYCDITPILEMTWLKNLWAPGRSYSVRQQLEEALPNTHLQLNKKAPAGEGWRDLPNYFAQRDILGMHYMK